LDQALREEVATKSDIAAVKIDLAAARTKLSAEIAAVRTELSAKIAAVDTRLTTVEHKLRVEIQTAKHDVLHWMVGMDRPYCRADQVAAALAPRRLASSADDPQSITSAVTSSGAATTSPATGTTLTTALVPRTGAATTPQPARPAAAARMMNVRKQRIMRGPFPDNACIAEQLPGYLH
jgi:hypothetical protein